MKKIEHVLSRDVTNHLKQRVFVRDIINDGKNTVILMESLSLDLKGLKRNVLLQPVTVMHRKKATVKGIIENLKNMEVFITRKYAQLKTVEETEGPKDGVKNITFDGENTVMPNTNGHNVVLKKTAIRNTMHMAIV